MSWAGWVLSVVRYTRWPWEDVVARVPMGAILLMLAEVEEVEGPQPVGGR